MSVKGEFGVEVEGEGSGPMIEDMSSTVKQLGKILTETSSLIITSCRKSLRSALKPVVSFRWVGTEMMGTVWKYSRDYNLAWFENKVSLFGLPRIGINDLSIYVACDCTT